MARLSADLIRRSSQFLSSIKERVLDLRGNKIAILDNLGATEDQFDTIDLSDNQIVKLENFPFMNRLGTLLINNNRITLINPNLGDCLPKMHTLVLTNNRLTSLAEIDPLTSFRNLQFLSLLGNTVTNQPDYRLYVINKLKHLHLLDLQKVKQQERTEAVQKFHSKEAEEVTKKVAAKSYTPIVMDAQGTTKNQGPKVVAPTPAQITAIKERAEKAQKFHSNEAEKVANKVAAKDHTPVVMDAQGTAQDQGPKVVIPTPVQVTDTKILKDEETREKYDYAVAHPEEALSTGQVTSEFALPKLDTNMAEASEETEAEEMETDGQDQEDGAEEQKQTDESTQIQEAFCAVQIHTEYVIRETNKVETDWKEQNDGADEQRENEESRLNTSIVEEMLGVGLDSTSTDICHIESYVYKNFQRAPFNFIFSWRKRPFRGLHIIPSPRRQESGDCAYHATLCIMECSFKVKYARRGPRKNREFNVRLSHDHLKMLVLDFMASEDGKGLRPRDKLCVCLVVAMKYGVVSEKDFKDGCPPGVGGAVPELPDDEKEGIPDLLDKAKMVLTSFRVTPQYRSLRPHDIYRYLPAEDVVYQESISSGGMHESHCVVLTNHGLAYPALEEVATEAEVSMPERYFEYLNSYSAGYGVDGSGYIYSDSVHKCYTVVV